MLVLLSGVSGAGKDTIKKELIKRMENVESLPSYTDRAPRNNDIPGVTYNFVTTDEFFTFESFFFASFAGVVPLIRYTIPCAKENVMTNKSAYKILIIPRPPFLLICLKHLDSNHQIQ